MKKLPPANADGSFYHIIYNILLPFRLYLCRNVLSFQVDRQNAFLDLDGIGDAQFFSPSDVLFNLLVTQHVGGDQSFLIDHVVDKELRIQEGTLTGQIHLAGHPGFLIGFPVRYISPVILAF